MVFLKTKLKAKTNKGQILFINARNVYIQIDRVHRKFSDDQIKNLGVIQVFIRAKQKNLTHLWTNTK